MDTIIVEGLRDTVLNIFITMIGTEPSYTGVREVGRFRISGDVIGVMSLSGKSSGMVACGVSEEFARKIVSRMTGIKTTEITAGDLSDGLAEIANMVCGGLKNQVLSTGVELSPPLSIIGTNSTLEWKIDHPAVVLAFEMDGMTFEVMACI